MTHTADDHCSSIDPFDSIKEIFVQPFLGLHIQYDSGQSVVDGCRMRHGIDTTVWDVEVYDPDLGASLNVRCAG